MVLEKKGKKKKKKKKGGQGIVSPFLHSDTLVTH
jgi:hypothetical protein